MAKKENAVELWDLYTRDRQKTGWLHRRGIPMPQEVYRLAVHVCIFNHAGQLLIQKRQPFKAGWPNMWDLSVGGSAVAGETSWQAAQRETWEELGLKLDLSQARPMFTLNFPQGFDDFYFIEQEVALDQLKLQASEVKQVRWAQKEEVLQMQAEGIMVPYWFLGQLFEIRATYDAWGERLHEVTVVKASFNHLESWMSLAEIAALKNPLVYAVCPEPSDDVVHSYLESQTNQAACTISTKQHMQYQETVRTYIKQGCAACALDGAMVVGLLLCSKSGQQVCSLVVHPEYHEHQIEARLLDEGISLIAKHNE